MRNEIVKLKQAINVLENEQANFNRYNSHLKSAISHISDSNEKLLFSLHEKYQYFSVLDYKNKIIETNIQKKVESLNHFNLSFDPKNNSLIKEKSNVSLNSDLNFSNELKNGQISSSNLDNTEVSHSSDSFNQSNFKIRKKNKLKKSISKNQNNEKYSNTSNGNSTSSKTVKSSMKYSQNSIKSLVMQSFSPETNSFSFQELKEKEYNLNEENQKLQKEFDNLLSQIEEKDIFLQFQKESESYLKALKQLREIESNSNIESIELNSENSQKEVVTNIESNKEDDNQSCVSSIFLTDVEAKINSQPEKVDIPKNNSSEKTNSFNYSSDIAESNSCVDPIIIKKEECGCQTKECLKTKSMLKNFSQEAFKKYLENQKNEIAFRRSTINELILDIEKSEAILKEIAEKRSKIISSLTPQLDTMNINIFNEIKHEDKETETDEQIDFENIMLQIEENSKFSKEFLYYSNERFRLKTIFEQKSLELKLAQMSIDRKTANYRSLLRSLKVTDPERYSKFIGTVGMSTKEEQKRQKYIIQISKFTEKIKKANEETADIESRKKQIKLRIEMLERELTVYKNPKDHVKSTLADICQKITMSQEKIRDQLREMSLIKMQSDFIDRLKTRVFKKISQNDDLNFKIDELYAKIKKIKGRCRYSLRVDQNYPITSPSEIKILDENFNILEKKVHNFDDAIAQLSNKSFEFIQQMNNFNLNIPYLPLSCQTIRNSLNHVL